MAGVMSDHECTTVEEARERIRLGMWLMIREGSAARNLDALLPLVKELHPPRRRNRHQSLSGLAPHTRYHDHLRLQ